MDIHDIFTQCDTFDADVVVVIPRKGNDLKCQFKAEFLYLDQDQIDAMLAGEPVEIGGTVLESGDDLEMLDRVLKGWTGWKIDGNEIDYNPKNHDQALKHSPIRSQLLAAYFRRLTGAEDGNARGGKRGKRKN